VPANDFTLTKAQKGQLHTIVQHYSFEPNEFTLETVPSTEIHGRTVTRMRHKATGCYFLFDVQGTEIFACHVSPGIDLKTERHTCETWTAVLSWWTNWLTAVAVESATPDPWEEIAELSQSVPITPAPDASNEKFSIQELVGIWKALTVIQETLLTNASDAADHRTYVEGQISFLVDSSKTMGRKDWLILAVGALVGFVQALALPPDAAQTIYFTLRDALKGIVKLLGA